MKTAHTLVCIAGLAFLTGCAAAPKVGMSDAQYREFAAKWSVMVKCGGMGLVAPETASLGQQYIESYASNFAFDQTRMTEALSEFNEKMPSATECNQAAVFVATRKRQIDQSNAVVAADQKAWSDASNSRSKQTYGNRIGSQVLCSTY